MRPKQTKMKQLFLFLFILTGAITNINAMIIKGLAKDSQTLEELIGAAIYIKEYTELGTTTGLDGSFILKNIPQNKTLTIVCTYVGYDIQTQQYDPSSNKTI